MADPVFEEEQAHLSKTYDKIAAIEHEAQHQLKDIVERALVDRDTLADEFSLDRSRDVLVETSAELESINRIIDAYNLSADVTTETIKNARLLLKQPYFAKISVQFRPGAAPRDIYIGNVGMTDEDYHHFIVDWRSPVAEVYYNQENGPTSYEANGRKIDVDLKLRRQFDIEGRTLKACFDTTVAIQDALLLQSLSKQRSAHLTAITTTIQKEQNTVIRHKDVPVLLVHGIAGSGKTSVLLQRIAYLFYREREDLDPKDVCLITPNPVFQRYIEDVLPEMGETNPTSTTWDGLMEELGLKSRGIGADVTASDLDVLESAVPELTLTKADFNDIRVVDEVVISAGPVKAAFDKYSRFPVGTHRSSLAVDDLAERLEQRIKRLAASDKAQGMVADLDVDAQVEVFGSVLDLSDMTEQELKEKTEAYLRWRYQGLEERIEDGAWLNIDRIGMRMTGKETLSSVEWIYLKLALVGGAHRQIRYVVIDEVQDYTAAQLMVLDRLFPNAHFLMLGDENQAIREQTATFSEIKEVFGRTRKTAEECALMTSYRSSPEITALFKKLLPPEERLEAKSVQRPGTEPVIVEAKDDGAFADALVSAVDSAREADCLAAVIAPNKQRMNQLAKLLGARVTPLSGPNDTLPDKGVVLLSVRLAKGLEFDRVIVTDADAGSYPVKTVARHRLYTAISRATQHVTLIAKEKLTPLLG